MSTLAELVARRPVHSESEAAQWVERSNRRFGRVTSSPVFGVAFAVLLLSYLLSGWLALGLLAVIMIPAFLAALAIWGGAHAWDRDGRPTAPAPVTNASAADPNDHDGEAVALPSAVHTDPSAPARTELP